MFQNMFTWFKNFERLDVTTINIEVTHFVHLHKKDEIFLQNAFKTLIFTLIMKEQNLLCTPYNTQLIKIIHLKLYVSGYNVTNEKKYNFKQFGLFHSVKNLWLIKYELYL